MNRAIKWILTLMIALVICGELPGLLPFDLEEEIPDFVLSTKKIDVPGYPTAFNASIVKWGQDFLLAFRVMPDLTNVSASSIGLVWLDENFNAISTPQILEIPPPSSPKMLD